MKTWIYTLALALLTFSSAEAKETLIEMRSGNSELTIFHDGSLIHTENGNSRVAKKLSAEDLAKVNAWGRQIADGRSGGSYLPLPPRTTGFLYMYRASERTLMVRSILLDRWTGS